MARYHISYAPDSDPDALMDAIKTLDVYVTNTGRTGQMTDPMNGTCPCIEVESSIELDRTIMDMCNVDDIDPDTIHPGFFSMVSIYKGPLGAETFRIRKGFSNTPLPPKCVTDALPKKPKGSGYSEGGGDINVIPMPHLPHGAHMIIAQDDDHATRCAKEAEDAHRDLVLLLESGKEPVKPTDTAWPEFVQSIPERLRILFERNATRPLKKEDISIRLADAYDGRILAFFSLKQHPAWTGHFEPLMQRMFRTADPAGPMAVALLGDADEVRTTLEAQGFTIYPRMMMECDPDYIFAMKHLSYIPDEYEGAPRLSTNELYEKQATHVTEKSKERAEEKIMQGQAKASEKERNHIMHACYHESLF